MAESTRHDAFQSGSNYETYMGRWSRRMAPEFLRWLAPAENLRWLEVGCGTGALAAAVLEGCNPAGIVGIDLSEGFVAHASRTITDPRAQFRVGSGDALPEADGGFDCVVSALALNFIPDRVRALREMKRVLKPGGTIGFYVWDYPGGGMGVMRAFWSAAVAENPQAQELSEDQRFPFCTPEGLAALAESAGLSRIETRAIESTAVFPDFEAYWHPFTLGAGPAPGYCMSLPESERAALRARLQADLAPAADGSITLPLRAWAVRAAG